LLEQGRDGVGPDIELISPTDGLPALPSRSVHHLRMIAQESLTNAIKHAGAKRVDLILEPVPGGLVLRIRDDGRGFDTGVETSGKSGHFGCMGMRERCRKIGARIEWRSAPGEGTEVTVILTNPQKEEGFQ
jgi:signal transduction histidine kinase